LKLKKRLENGWLRAVALGDPRDLRLIVSFQHMVLELERMGDHAVGIARAALEDSLAYVQQRRAFGQAIAEFQGTQWRLADMATAVEAARLLTLRAAFLKDRGLPYTKEAAMAKLFAAETAMSLAIQGVQLHGGYGYTREFAAERYFRDAKITEIYEGTSEIQRLVIASQLLREAGAR